VQRAILFAALIGVPPVLRPEELSDLQQAATDARSDLSAFNSAASPAEQKLFGNTVSGAAVDRATALEILAEQSAATHPSAPLTGQAGLDAGTWYPEMTTTIADTRVVTGHLVGQLSGQADALKSDAIRNLLLTSMVTLLLLLVLLTSAGRCAGNWRPGTRVFPLDTHVTAKALPAWNQSEIVCFRTQWDATARRQHEPFARVRPAFRPPSMVRWRRRLGRAGHSRRRVQFQQPVQLQFRLQHRASRA
jgi:hypothetical protein